MTDADRDEAAARLAEQGRRLTRSLEKAAGRVRKRSDPEAIHDARVLTRRLDAALDLGRAVIPGARRRRARRALRGLRRRIGRAREAQVNTTLLERFLAESIGADPVAAALVLDRMRSRREKLEQRACAADSRSRAVRALRRVERAWASVATIGADPAWLEAAGVRLGRRAQSAQASLEEALERRDEDSLHRARIAIKRWRYSSEAMAIVSPETETPAGAWFRSIQESLGQIHDLAVLRAALERMKKRPLRVEPERAVTLLGALIERIEGERLTRIEKLGSGDMTSARRLVVLPVAGRG